MWKKKVTVGSFFHIWYIQTIKRNVSCALVQKIREKIRKLEITFHAYLSVDETIHCI